MEHRRIIPKRAKNSARVAVGSAPALDLTALECAENYNFGGIDLERNGYYIRRREAAESSLNDEKLQKLRKQNYFTSYRRAYYVGSDKTDWVVVVGYDCEAPVASYSRLLCVKNGRTVYDTGILDLEDFWDYSGGRLITAEREKGVTVFDVNTHQLRNIQTDSSGNRICVCSMFSVVSYDGGYVLLQRTDSENSAFYLYISFEDELVRINISPDNMITDEWRIIDGVLQYIDADGKPCKYNLKTHRESVFENIESAEFVTAETDGFFITTGTVHNIVNFVGMSCVEITRKSDGMKKVFDLRGFLPEENLYLPRFYSEGGWLYIVGEGEEKIALCFETETAADISGAKIMSYYGTFLGEIPLSIRQDCSDGSNLYMEVCRFIPPDE